MFYPMYTESDPRALHTTIIGSTLHGLCLHDQGMRCKSEMIMPMRPQILMNEFGYHPEFKRPGDSFSAVPFRPL